MADDSAEEGEIQDDPSLEELSSFSSGDMSPTPIITGNQKEKENCQENSPSKKGPNHYKKAKGPSRKRKHKGSHRSVTASSDSDEQSSNKRSKKSCSYSKIDRHKVEPPRLKPQCSRKLLRKDRPMTATLKPTAGNSLMQRLKGMLVKDCDDDDDIQILETIPPARPIVLDITGDTVVCLTKEPSTNSEIEDEDQLRLQALHSAVIKNQKWRESKNSNIEVADKRINVKSSNSVSNLSGGNLQPDVPKDLPTILKTAADLVVCMPNLGEVNKPLLVSNMAFSNAGQLASDQYIKAVDMESTSDLNITQVPSERASEVISSENLHMKELSYDGGISSCEIIDERPIVVQHVSTTRDLSKKLDQLAPSLPAVASEPCVPDWNDSCSDSEYRDVSKMIVLDEVSGSPDRSAHIDLIPGLPNIANTSKSLIATTSISSSRFSSNTANVQVTLPLPTVSLLDKIINTAEDHISFEKKRAKQRIFIENSETSKRVFATSACVPRFEPNTPPGSSWTKWTSNQCPSPARKTVPKPREHSSRVITAKQNKRFVIRVNHSSDSEEEEENFPKLTRTIVNDLASPVINKPIQDPYFAQRLDALLKESRESQTQKAKESASTSASTEPALTSAVIPPIVPVSGTKKRKSRRASTAEPVNPKQTKTTITTAIGKRARLIAKVAPNRNQNENINPLQTAPSTGIPESSDTGGTDNSPVQLEMPQRTQYNSTAKLNMVETRLVHHREMLCDTLTGLLAQIDEETRARDYIAQQKMIITQAQSIIFQSRLNILETKKENEERLQQMNLIRENAAQCRDQCRMVEAYCLKLGTQLREGYIIPNALVREIREKLVEVKNGFEDIRMDNKPCKKLAHQTHAVAADSTDSLTTAGSTVSLDTSDKEVHIVTASSTIPLAAAVSTISKATTISTIPLKAAVSKGPAVSSVYKAPAVCSVSNAPAVCYVSKAPSVGTVSKAPAFTVSKAPAASTVSKAPSVYAASKAPVVSSVYKASAVSRVSKAPAVCTIFNPPAVSSISTPPAVSSISKAPSVATIHLAQALSTISRATALSSVSKAPAILNIYKPPAVSISKPPAVSNISRATAILNISKPSAVSISKPPAVSNFLRATAVSSVSKAPAILNVSKPPAVANISKATAVSSVSKAPAVLNVSKPPAVSTAPTVSAVSNVRAIATKATGGIQRFSAGSTRTKNVFTGAMVNSTRAMVRPGYAQDGLARAAAGSARAIASAGSTLAVLNIIEQKRQMAANDYAFYCPFEANGSCTDMATCLFDHKAS